MYYYVFPEANVKGTTEFQGIKMPAGNVHYWTIGRLHAEEDHMILDYWLQGDWADTDQPAYTLKRHEFDWSDLDEQTGFIEGSTLRIVRIPTPAGGA